MSAIVNEIVTSRRVEQAEVQRDQDGLVLSTVVRSGDVLRYETARLDSAAAKRLDESLGRVLAAGDYADLVNGPRK